MLKDISILLRIEVFMANPSHLSCLHEEQN